MLLFPQVTQIPIYGGLSKSSTIKIDAEDQSCKIMLLSLKHSGFVG